MKHKKKIIIGIIGLILISLLFINLDLIKTKEPLAGNRELWRFISPSSVVPIVSSWHLGSSASRIAKGWFTDLDATTGTIGTLTVSSTATGPLIVNGNIRASIGTVASPSYTFRTDQDTGMYMPASNSLGFSTLGANRIYIDSSGQVGIGTTGPAVKLQVSGAQAAASTTAENGILLISASGGQQLAIGGAAASPYGLWLQTKVNTNDGTTYPLVLNPIGGNVGIGTTGPAVLLHANALSAGSTVAARVQNTDNTNAASHAALQLQVGGGSGGDPYVHFAGAVSEWSAGVDNSDSDKFKIGDAGTLGTAADIVTIQTDGNVGIGTTTPTSLLTVQGRGEFQGTASASYLLTGNTLQVGGFASAAYSRFGTSTLTTNPAGNWITGSNDLLISGDLYGVGSIAFAGPASISNTLFVGTGGKTGFVGIGTTSPVTKLNILGTSEQTRMAYDASNYGSFSVGSSGTLTISVEGNDPSIQLSTVVGGVGPINLNSGNISGTGSNAGVTIPGNFLTSGQALAAVNTSKTSGTLVSFQINGTVAAADQTVLDVATTGATATADITTYGAQISNIKTNATGGTNVALYLNASGATTANYGLIVNSGNVGVGTTAPSNKLNVVDDTNAIAARIEGSSTSGTQLYIRNDDLTNAGDSSVYFSVNAQNWIAGIDNSDSDKFKIEAGSSTIGAGLNVLTLQTTGEVGIGETAPGSKLSVSGGGSFGASYDTTAAPLDGLIIEGNVGIGSTAPTGKLDIVGDLTGSANPLFRVASASELFRITEAGNVGIGTTVPSAKLQISAGDILLDNGQFIYAKNAAGTDTQIFGIDTNSDITLARGNLDSINNNNGRIIMVLGTAKELRILNAANNAFRLFIKESDGNVGIGNNGSPNAVLDVIGTASISGAFRAESTVFFKGISAGAAGDTAACLNTTTNELTDAGASTCIVSSKRFKKDIKPLNTGLKEVLKLKPVEFAYNNDLKSVPHLGLIAEDVLRVEPRLVFFEPDGKTPRGIEFELLTALLVKSDQDLNAKIEKLEIKVSRLEARLNALEGKPLGGPPFPSKSKKNWLMKLLEFVLGLFSKEAEAATIISIRINNKILTKAQYDNLKALVISKFETKTLNFNDGEDWKAIISNEMQKCGGWTIKNIKGDLFEKLNEKLKLNKC